MKLETPFWFCDNCGKKIATPEDGWVEWVMVWPKGKKRKGRNLRIVHHYVASPLKEFNRNGCYMDRDREYEKDGGMVGNHHLTAFTGLGGLVRLLAFLHEGALPKKEVIEVIRRIFVPGYEIARSYFDELEEEGIIDPHPHGGDLLYTIATALEYVQARNEED